MEVFFFPGGWFRSTADEIQNQVVMGMQAKGQRESLRVEERKKQNKTKQKEGMGGFVFM